MLGEKIKKARKKLGMTQAELAGERMTRNMISCIENGSANPSIANIEYIAEKLNLPVSFFFADELDESTYVKLASLSKIKDAFRHKDFKECITLAQDIETPDDEIALILAKAYFEIGKVRILEGALASAIKTLKISLEYCNKTIYDTTAIEATLPLYLSVAQNLQFPLIHLDENEYFKATAALIDFEFYKYLSVDTEYDYTVEEFATHIKAKALIKQREYEKALPILLSLENSLRKEHYNALLKFSIYTDIENCYKHLSDYENAYRYSSKRLSLIESFKA